MRKNKASTTARKVALNIVTLGAYAKTRDVLPDGLADATADMLIMSGAQGRTGVRMSQSNKMVWVYRAFDWMMPGQFEAFAHRKAFCESQVRAAIEAGARQVLVLGAGYDLIGWRLASEFPDVKFFEIDHPATARVKAKGIEAMGMRPNLHLIAEDLSEHRLTDVLKADPVWEPAQPSVFVAEGLLQYLPEEAAADLFRQCADFSGSGSRMVFTHVGTRENRKPDAGPWSGLVLWILKKNGEPWLWSINPDELDLFLRQNGWREKRAADQKPNKHGIEYFAAAEK